VAPFTGNTGTVINNYGLYINELNVGTNRWAIYTVGATESYFGGKVTFNTSVKSSAYAVSALNSAPLSATDTGVTGEIRYTSDYIYICTATNTWKRTAISTF
jgi:hypothetical protein